MKYIIILLCAVTTMYSCKTQSYTLDNYEGPVLEFGNSGGFAGAILNFSLLENGQLFKSTNGKDYTEIVRLKKKVVKQMFNNYESLNLRDIQMDDPGNMTYHVSMQDGRNTHKIKWGGTPGQAPLLLQQYYTTLVQLTNVNKINN